MLGLSSVFSKLLLRPQHYRQPVQLIHVSQIDLRARKGTRERREKLKKKTKIEITKVGYIPHNLRKAGKKHVDKHLTTDWKRIPTDDAYPGRYYRWPLYKLLDAIKGHKETHDPTMYNSLDAPLNVDIEMNMTGDRPSRMVPNFSKLILLKHPFEHGQERNILVFAKEEENLNRALEAGATTAGGVDLVKSALKGNVRFADYQFILAHPEIMPEIIALRGLLKKKFPSPKTETLGVDMYALVKKFTNGLTIQAKRDDNQENFGLIKTCIGTLNMPSEELVDNFNAIITGVNSHRPNRGGKFITRVLFTSPPSTEIFRIDPADFPFSDYEREETAAPTKSTKKGAPIKFERTYQLFRNPV